MEATSCGQSLGTTYSGARIWSSPDVPEHSMHKHPWELDGPSPGQKLVYTICPRARQYRPGLGGPRFLNRGPVLGLPGHMGAGRSLHHPAR